MNPFIVYSDRYICDIGDHVFPIDKYVRVGRQLREAGVPPDAFVDPRPATREELQRVHDAEYLDDFFQLRQTKRTMFSELPLNQSIVDLSVLSTGGTLVAAELAEKKGYAYHVGGGWHHAFAGHAEGFCYLNDTAVATRALQRRNPVMRIAVVDLDLHQGNGTAGIFRHDYSVFTFSMHQENLYPLKQPGRLDVGLSEGTTDQEYLDQLKPSLDRIFNDFRPAFVFYLAGADPYQYDQLGQLKLTQEGLKQRDRIVLERCRDARVPVAVLLAGGYAVNSEDTVAIHVNTAIVLCKVFGLNFNNLQSAICNLQ